MMMNIHNSPTSTSSSDHLTPPPPSTKNSDDQVMVSGELLQTTLPHCDGDENLHEKMMLMNPRKKRTKMVRIDNAASTSTNVGATTKPKYYKKPDPSAPKITRPCTECGKRFWSVKALFGHMRCHPERQWRGINPPPNLRRPCPSASDHQRHDWVSPVTEDDQQVASCLLMLANAPPPPPCNAASTSVNTNYTVGVLDSGIRDQNVVFGCQDIGNNPVMDDHGAGPSGVNSFKFECSSCKKVFGSHQALGGHRASHKNVKGCFAINKSVDGTAEDDYNILGGHEHRNIDQPGHHCGDQDKMLMALGHKCSICLRVFSSGQALGGHKRCHWEKGDELSSLTLGVPGSSQHRATKGASALDLNLPVPHEDDHSSSTWTSGLSLDLRLGL